MKTFAGLPIQNTSNLVNENTRICMLCYQAAKYGKTTLAASLDTLTQYLMDKKTLFIPIEVGEGGGTMSIQDYGVDYIVPRSMSELDKLIATLAHDATYGGVVLDSASEYIHRFLKPYALKFNFPGANNYPTRALGVPARSDYQTMGEESRNFFNRLVGLTTTINPKTNLPDDTLRKHVFVTALIREKTDNDGNLLRIGPDLPGAMMDAATAMFQTVATIDIAGKVVPDPANPKRTTRIYERLLRTKGRGKEILGDRTRCFPSTFNLTNDDNTPKGLLELWKEYWEPRFKEDKTND